MEAMITMVARQSRREVAAAKGARHDVVVLAAVDAVEVAVMAAHEEGDVDMEATA
jgi:hypothetical protein